MGNFFIKRLTAPASAIDINRHVNNLAYLHWVQAMIIEHALDAGCGVRHMKAIGGTWAIASNAIDYFVPAREGDDIAIFHWVARLGEKSIERRFLFYRVGDDTVLAEVKTIFVYVDLASGKGAPLPDEIRRIFAVTEESDPLLAALRAEPPQRGVILPALAFATPLSDDGVHSLTVHPAILPSKSG